MDKETAKYLLNQIEWRDEFVFHADDWEEEIYPPECSKCGHSFDEDQEIYLSTWCGECGVLEIEKIYSCSFDQACSKLEFRDLDEYDLELEFQPDDYDLCKEAYSPNSWHAYMRHNRSNYDDLLKGLCKLDPIDRIRYDGIRFAFESQLRSKLETI